MMNDKYLIYISIHQITNNCPWTLSGESIRGHCQGKVSPDTARVKGPRTVCGFVDGARNALSNLVTKIQAWHKV